MKTRKISLLTMIIALSVFTFSFTSCDDDDDKSVSKEALSTAITSASELLSTTEEGTAEGQFMPGSKKVLQTVIDAAQTIYDSEKSTQTMMDNAVANINAAIEVYNGNIVEAIAADALVGHWTFDDGSGTTLKDYSGNSFDGTLLAGTNTWGGGLPAWTSDRYGNEGGALSFDNGAYVKIPYNTSLNPKSMTISLWVNASETLEGNRFIGLHSWNGYKFQLQAANRPFFTVATDDGIFDKDANVSVDTLTWYNLAVTYNDGTMAFYINGAEAVSYTDLTGDIAANSGNDLVFGRGSDVYAADATNYDNDNIIPLAWGGYFHGKMDEVRIYNTPLSASQILSIYNLEKVPEEEKAELFLNN
ncbi:MAG: LamG domain-containing protein [Bacteroidales bacterium]|jgi:hypothetical protein|nr:LamG domain-containing protein [Bacteroidales bacterium]